MSEDFKARLELYKKGKLAPEESEIIENEIERYIALKEYLYAEDEEFISGLKQELDRNVPASSLVSKKINKKIIFKIVKISLITILSCLIIIPSLYFSVLSTLGNAFRIDDDRFIKEQNFAEQFIHMAFPEVDSIGGGNHTEFYNQTAYFNIVRGISRKAEPDQIEFRYSFGRLQKPKTDLNGKLDFYSSDLFYAINTETYFKDSEWEYLEKAPPGTRARIFLTFKEKMEPEKARAALGDSYFAQKDFAVDMLAFTGSSFILANSDPVYFYNQNSNSAAKSRELDFMNSFNGYDNNIHKEVMLYGLQQIKKYRNIAEYITQNYTYSRDQSFSEIDDIINTVEQNGVQYVGAIASGDTKELLKLKNNPYIYACRVDDIVVW